MWKNISNKSPKSFLVEFSWNKEFTGNNKMHLAMQSSKPTTMVPDVLMYFDLKSYFCIGSRLRWCLFYLYLFVIRIAILKIMEVPFKKKLFIWTVQNRLFHIIIITEIDCLNHCRFQKCKPLFCILFIISSIRTYVYIWLDETFHHTTE